MKRLIAGLLIVCCLLTLLPFTVTAEETDLREELHRQLLARAEQIDVKKLGYNVDQISDLFWSTVSDYGDLFFVSNEYSYSKEKETGIVTKITPSYVYDEDEVALAVTLADGIIAQTKDDWSELELALYFHDYLCTHFQYDLRLFFEEWEDSVNRTMYGLLTEGVGVCEAYAKTYQYLLQKCGVDCRLVSNRDARHMWNLVKIDGNWYHVDVTEDDPVLAFPDGMTLSVLDRAGFVSHAYFLKSDDSFYDKEDDGYHYDWHVSHNDTIPATSRKYDAGSVFDYAVSAFAEVDGVWYFWNDTPDRDRCPLQMTTDFLTVDGTYTQLDEYWLCADDNKYYPLLCSGLGSYGDLLVFNNDSMLYVMDPVRHTTFKIVPLVDMLKPQNMIDCYGDPVTEVPEKLFIYGFCMEGHRLVLQCSHYLTDEIYYLVGYDLFPNGDADFNGVVDTADLVAIKKYLAGVSEVEDLSGMDLDYNGVVDTGDLLLLKKALAGLIEL